jgi:toxin FitB
VIVLDTNVISELARPAPFPAVLAWARRQMPEEVFTTSICEAELLFGVNDRTHGLQFRAGFLRARPPRARGSSAISAPG